MKNTLCRTRIYPFVGMAKWHTHAGWCNLWAPPPVRHQIKFHGLQYHHLSPFRTMATTKPTSRSTVHCSKLLFLRHWIKNGTHSDAVFTASLVHLLPKEAENKRNGNEIISALTSGTIAGVGVLVPLSAHSPVLTRARIARDVFVFAILAGEAFFAGTPETKITCSITYFWISTYSIKTGSGVCSIRAAELQNRVKLTFTLLKCRYYLPL